MPRNTKANETILTPATPTGASLRATVPVFIISQFKLKKGDSLRWYIKGKHLVVEIIKNDGKRYY